MSQIWTIDTDKIEALRASTLGETTLAGVFTDTTTSETLAFTKIKKQTTDNLDLYVADAWEQISLTDIETDGGTISFESSAIGQAVRTWLKLFANFTSTTIDTLVGYTWTGDDNPYIERGTIESYYLHGVVDNVAFNRYIFNNLETHEMWVYVFPEDVAEYGSSYYLYGDPDLGDPPRWSSEASRTAYITGGSSATNATCIAQFLQNGDLVASGSLIQVDLSRFSLPSGRHVIQMKLSDDGETHANSDLSSANVYYDVPYTIDFSGLSNVTKASGPAMIGPVETITLTFTAATGYALPDSVTVTGATPTWTKDTGTLVLEKALSNTDPVSVTIVAIFMPKLNACSAEFDAVNDNIVIITPDDGNGVATQFAMYDNGATTGVVIPRQT